MSNGKPVYFQDPDKMADFIIERVGKEIVLGMQLGLGKPNNIANAIYRKALKDPSINLRIITALGLETPGWSSDLERRMLEPIIERVWDGYIELDYVRDQRKGKLPSNIEISEFFYKAGAFLGNKRAQQNYISTNYTYAARDIMANGLNVAGGLIAKDNINGEVKFSVSCNGDTALDAFDLMEEATAAGKKTVKVGEVNNNLPFMYGDSVIDENQFDAILESPDSNYTLFGAPKESVNTTDFKIGFNASTLIKDGGTLQIGIGSLGDAVAYGLTVRQKHNEDYKSLMESSGLIDKSGDLIDETGGSHTFEEGIYGCTEMLVDSYLDMHEADIVKRRVYEDINIQEMVYDKKFDGAITADNLKELLERGAVNKAITEDDLKYLTGFGIVKEGLELKDGNIVDGGDSYSADLSDDANFAKFAEKCLGPKLKGGYWVHAGFFLGPQLMYQKLNNMSVEDRKEINMTSVLNVNQLYANNRYMSEELKVLHRRHGRFINAGLMVSLSGAITSDGLEDNRVVSGIGGQYNFIAKAQIMKGARSAIMIRSTRKKGKDVMSNIVFNYGHTSVPRHLRDIVITEYGLADLRAKTDQEVAIALIKIADSRFQDELLNKAKSVGKVAEEYELPAEFRNNTPEKLEAELKPFREKGLFGAFPFGTDFTDEEIVIGKALREFKEKFEEDKFKYLPGLLKQFVTKVPENTMPFMKRMQLENPKTREEKKSQKILAYALTVSGQLS